MPLVEVPGLGKVDFPEGTSHADMVSAIETSLKGKSGQMALDSPRTLQFGPLDTGIPLPKSIGAGLEGAGKAVSDLGQGIGQWFGMNSKQDVADTRARDSALMDTTAGKVGNFAGNVGIALPTMFIPGVNTYTGSAVLGGALGAAQPVAEGESRGMNTGLGAAFGVLGQGAGNLVGRAIRPVQSTLPPELERLAQEAANRGIPLTAGQRTGSRPLLTAESVMETLPMTSGPQLAQRQAQGEAFNRAVGSTFGAPENALTPDVMGQARTRIGQTFTDLSNRNAANVDNAVMTRLSTVIDDANRYNTPDVARVVQNYADDILSRVDNNGQIPGTAYRALDSQMGRTMRGSSNGDLRNYVGQLRDVMREAMDNSISTADQQAWRGARQQYANLMTVAPVAARNEIGNVSGRTLLSAANNSNRNARFGAPSELAELGRIGRAFVADQIPNSGTAQRMMMQSLLTGGGAGIGAVGAAATGNDPLKGAGIGAGVTAGGLLSPRIAQMLMNSEAGQRYLTQGLLPLTEREIAMLTAAGRGAGTAGLIGYTPQQ